MAYKINTKDIFKKPTKKVKGDIEKECHEEVAEVITEFSKQAKAEQDKFKENTDANYFTVVTFNNSNQLQEFLNKVGLTPSDSQYIDGLALCKKLGIKIETPNKEAPGKFKINKKILELT